MEIVYEPFEALPLSEFHEELLFEYPNLPTELFDYYLVSTAIKMAKAGNLIRRRIVIDAQQGVTRYRLNSPDGLDIHAILGIRSAPACSCGAWEINRSFDPPEGAALCGREISWYDPQDNVLHINPPFCEGRYFVSVAVTPQRGACELPKQYLTEFFPALMMGTKGNILLITGRPWTNLQLGNAYVNEFMNMISTDAVDTATNRQRGAVKMQFGRVM